MPKKAYRVELTQEERNTLKKLLTCGEAPAQKLTRARVLLKSDAGWSDEVISCALDVGTATVERLRKRYVEEGLEATLNRRPTRRHYRRKIDGRTEAHLIALACSTPPIGHQRWTIRLLAEHLVALDQVELASVSRETIRRALKKTNSNLGVISNG